MDWPQARERLAAPIFAPFADAIAKLPRGRWPTHDDLTQAAADVVTSHGRPVRFAAPRAPGDRDRRSYELRIAESGEVETRTQSWHDLFNALVWIAFPAAKAAINAQHAAILAERGAAEARARGPERDALTLFDEGGVAVASSDPALTKLIVDFEWKELFWRRRAEVAEKMRFVAFGHALLEKALAPHVGIVAKTIFLPMDLLPEEAHLVHAIDARLAAHFADRGRFASPRAMAPMPVLGVPGWHPQSAHESFYDDRDHFRAKTGGVA
jgi:DUF3025 family protein